MSPRHLKCRGGKKEERKKKKIKYLPDSPTLKMVQQCCEKATNRTGKNH